MNRTDVLLAVIKLADIDGGMPPEDAISHITTLIDRLDMAHPEYENDVETLLKIGATIWTLNRSAGKSQPR